MWSWLIALMAGALAVLAGYWPLASHTGWAERVSMGARFVVAVLVVALVLDAPAASASRRRGFVALDASASWRREGDTAAWRAAIREARDANADSTFLFGDSVRAGVIPAQPTDAGSRVQPVVERALAAGRTLTVVTDGEVSDPEALTSLPAGSSVVIPPRRSRADVAIASMDAPSAAVAGDSIDVRVSVAAAGAGSGAGRVRVALDGTTVAEVPLDSLPAWGERTLSLRVKLGEHSGGLVLRAALTSANDAEPMNDTLAVALDVAPQASVVFVSSSPDADARWIIALLRGAIGLPTRAYLRVAPGQWRVEGSLAPIAEAEVQRLLANAPLAVLHGDTAIFGAPVTTTRGALALIAPPRERTGEWFAVAAPPSPLAGALGGVPWDSLPPIEAGAPAAGEWQALMVTRARGERAVPVVVGRTAPRRTVVVTASGFSAWRVRSGIPADAFSALWGAAADWLAADRPDERAARPAAGVLRDGEPVRWRRGGSADTLVRAVLTRRGGRGRARAATDTVTLRFARDVAEAQSPSLEAGTYDVRVKGGASVLVVNPSGEWVGRRPAVVAGAIGSGPAAGEAPGLRTTAWPFVVIVLLLCAEWILRRRAGLR